MTAIIQIGDPRLRQTNAPVADVHDPTFQADNARLHQALVDFRLDHGFGRAVAAPQLGIPRRLIAMNLDGRVFSVINPLITFKSRQTITLWDDCMSFPGLLVKVRRPAHISVQFTDETGQTQSWENLPVDQSELFQHEIDHLDGILAVDRALDRDALVSRRVFESNPDFYRAQVTHGGVYA